MVHIATGVMVALSAVIFVAVSLATEAPPADEIGAITFDRNTWREESKALRGKPWYRNYRWLSLGIIVATAAAVIPFV